eukprot:TRINITY_DN7327_c0_g1_i16.p1 TRINITY_DN7327_c0_g1~~TRINITY_DN7327_c0_g1_i16.p1  ORF type:complete len:117 (+),score=11.74 TRINITY_DN7327_c0_g1_i16:24-353(+)
MIRRPPRSTHCISSAASDVYKRQMLALTPYPFAPDFFLANITQLPLLVLCLRLARLRQTPPHPRLILHNGGWEQNARDEVNERGSCRTKLGRARTAKGHCVSCMRFRYH